MVYSGESRELTRRSFVKAGVAAAAGAGTASKLKAVQTAEEGLRQSPSENLVPTRVLGRTGQKVSMLNFGTAQRADARLFNAMYDAGVRYIDTADCYAKGAAEKAVGAWLAEKGNRKEFFLVDKDHPETPEDWVRMVDRRLEALQTDTIDLFFIHMLGADNDTRYRNWPRKKTWGQAAEQMKKSGKVRFVGFSTHSEVPLRAALLSGAAAGGWVDAVMMAYDPQVVRENKAFNRALDKCYEAGVGLICMKEMRSVQHVPKFLPQFEALGLTAHQAVLHAVWSDERISSICSAMPNLKILEENCAAAKNYKPMQGEQIAAVIELYKRYGRAYCNACDGRCRRAGGTQAALGAMARCLSYQEMDGCRAEARRAYAALSQEERDWRGADLAAASAACAGRLDFASLLPRAEEKLA